MENQNWRPYEFVRHYVEEGAGNINKLDKCVQTINLYDVKSYRDFKFTDFPSFKKPVTLITTYQGDNFAAQVTYEEFRGLFNEFLLDTEQLDPRTIKAYPMS